MENEETLGQKIQREAAINLENRSKEILAELETKYPNLFRIVASGWQGDLENIKYYAQECQSKGLFSEIRVRGIYDSAMNQCSREAEAKGLITEEQHIEITEKVLEFEHNLAEMAANILSSECNCRLSGV